jgi:hypothetical protein
VGSEILLPQMATAREISGNGFKVRGERIQLWSGEMERQSLRRSKERYMRRPGGSRRSRARYRRPASRGGRVAPGIGRGAVTGRTDKNGSGAGAG